MLHKTTKKAATSKGILASTYGWHLSLFNTTCDLQKSQVNHVQVKPHALKCLQPKTKHFMMPICMDRVDGQQLYAPENFAKLIALLAEKLPGFKFVIEVVLTGELNGYNIQRKNHLNNIEQTIEEARAEGRAEAEKYFQAITPYIEQLQLRGHRITVKHWSEYRNLSKIQDIYKHLVDGYATDNDYEICIDNALSKFYSRQVESGQRAPARIANRYNLKYILEESAFLIYVYAYLRDQFDHLIYEQDNLSPQISEAACQVARAYLNRDGVEFKNIKEFYLEFLLQRMNQEAAQIKQKTLEDHDTLERINALYLEDPTNTEVIQYHNASRKVNVLLSGSYGGPAFSFAKMFGKAIYLGVNTTFKPKGTYTEYRCFMIPNVGFRLNVLDSLPSTVSIYDADEFYSDRVMEYSIIIHHFYVNNERSVEESAGFFDQRIKLASSPSQKQCIVAHFQEDNVNLNTFSKFEKIKQSAPSYISEILYHGIFSHDLKRLQSKLPQLNKEEPDQYMQVELMDADQRQRQLAKFMQKLV